MDRPPKPMTDAVGTRAERKLRARQETQRGIWFGLGMFGVIGWSVAIPALVGIAVGIWLDQARPAGFSWTLTLLALGVTLGCLNAWLWVSRQRSSIKREGKDE
jgi:ATP synthase protein I